MSDIGEVFIPSDEGIEAIEVPDDSPFQHIDVTELSQGEPGPPGPPGGGATVFTDLTDVPANYSGEASKLVRVKGDESGLEFTNPPPPSVAFTDLTDVPANYSGGASKIVSVKGDESGLEFTTPATGDVVGPGSAVDGNLAVFDGVTGKLIKDGGPPGSGGGGGDIFLDLALRADSAVADAWVNKDLGADYSEVWLRFDLSYNAAAAAFWSTNPGNSGDFGDLMDGVGTIYTGVGYYGTTGQWFGFWGGGSSATPPLVPDTWQTCEMHYNSGVAEFYINGVLVFTSSNTANVIRKVQIGQTASGLNSINNAASIAFFRDVRVGTTRGGIDLFFDDFSLGDLSRWGTVSGDATLIENPYPVVTGDVVGPGSATDLDFVMFDGATGKLIKDGGVSLDTDNTLAANSDSHVSSQKATKDYIAAQVFASGSAIPYSSTYSAIARVDPNGNNGTGIVGDFSKPFLTVAAAITALEAIPGVAMRYIDIGATFFSEDITTSLVAVGIIGSDWQNNGINSITFTNTTGPLSLSINNAVCYAVNTNLSSNSITIYLTSSYCGDVTDSGTGGIYISGGFGSIGGGQCGNVTANNSVQLVGLSYAGIIVADATPTAIVIQSCMPGQVDYTTGSGILEINSPGSGCVISLSLVKITAANDVTLYDSRFYGTNGATGTTTNTDYFLS